MKPTSLDRSHLRRRFHQLKIDHEEISQLRSAIHELQQLKFSLEEKFYQNQKAYQADQRAWYEATHDTLVGTKSSRRKPKRDPELEAIFAELLNAEIAKRKEAK